MCSSYYGQAQHNRDKILSQWLLCIPPAFNIKKPCIISTRYIYAFKILRINSDYFPNSIKRLVFAMETHSVFCEVRTGFLYIIQINLRLQSAEPQWQKDAPHSAVSTVWACCCILPRDWVTTDGVWIGNRISHFNTQLVTALYKSHTD
jgi:hypothetical protein